MGVPYWGSDCGLLSLTFGAKAHLLLKMIVNPFVNTSLGNKNNALGKIHKKEEPGVIFTTLFSL